MQTEYEIRVLEINPAQVIKKIEALGGIKQGEWQQKRFVYDLKPKVKGQWIRLRTNGENTTLTFKNITRNTIDGTKEVEIIVDNFEKTHELLKCIGFEAKGYQENKRIRYLLNDVEIDLDSWPLIPPYLEIEGQNEQVVQETLKVLDVDSAKITTLNCDDIYRQIYGIDLETIKELKFTNELHQGIFLGH